MCFAVHRMAKFSSNTVKVKFDGLVHLLRYIRDKDNFGLGCYTSIEDAPLSKILRQAVIKTEKI